jgi:hypothetical protein
VWKIRRIRERTDSSNRGHRPPIVGENTAVTRKGRSERRRRFPLHRFTARSSPFAVESRPFLILVANHHEKAAGAFVASPTASYRRRSFFPERAQGARPAHANLSSPCFCNPSSPFKPIHSGFNAHSQCAHSQISPLQPIRSPFRPIQARSQPVQRCLQFVQALPASSSPLTARS